MLEVQEVWYQGILHGISRTWPAGRLVGLVGPNGAGKSTLLRILAGIWVPTGGSVRVEGMTVHQLPPRRRARRLSYLPQHLPDDIPFSVREFVEMGRYAHRPRIGGLTRADRQAVEAALNRLNLRDHGDDPLSRLSGGQRQRAAIARCLAQESRVLLLDEPVSNLDLYYQWDILRLLRELADEGRLIVMAIHHLELAAAFCDELLLLQEGRVHSAGPPALVLTPAAVRSVFGVDVNVFRDPFTGHLRLSWREGPGEGTPDTGQADLESALMTPGAAVHTRRPEGLSIPTTDATKGAEIPCERHL
jgi:ABC-type cobalamin/Fe3+-siderophores transport system ATPase subunit